MDGISLVVQRLNQTQRYHLKCPCVLVMLDGAKISVREDGGFEFFDLIDLLLTK
jgi:hypothetical protein